MGFPTIAVLGRSENKKYIRFLDNGIPVSIVSTTRMVIELDSGKEIDSDGTPGLFDWKSPVATGVAYLKLGILWWPTKVYYGKVITFDDFYPNGLFWGNMRIKAIENLGST